MASEISIVGAGIGGLCAALSLQRRGFAVRVFEQAAQLTEVGAGLTLSTGALKCFGALGLEDQVRGFMSKATGFPFLHYRTAERLAGDAAGADEAPPAPTAGGHIYRPDLHAILVSAVQSEDPAAIVTNRRLDRIVQTESHVTAHFVDGSSHVADCLIGADGVRSTVRRALTGEESPRFTGRMAFRFLLPGEVAQPLLGVGGRACVFVGPGKVFNRYLVSDGRLLNCVGLLRTGTWTAEGWSQPATVEEMLEAFQGWHPDVLALMQRAPADRLIKWGVFERDPLEIWTRGRVTLLGDAAHPMQPFLGLGAAMAIEDGFVLGSAFAHQADVRDAMSLYESARSARTAEIMLASARQGRIFDETDPTHYPPPNAPAHRPSLFDFDPLAAFADAL